MYAKIDRLDEIVETIQESGREVAKSDSFLEQSQEQLNTIENLKETENAEETTVESQEQVIKNVSELSEEEKAARKQKQNELNEARNQLYAQENSVDKTEQIRQLDRQILENNVYDFTSKRILFIGDSITEGLTAVTDENGVKHTYVYYANQYLQSQDVLNHGMSGRMFSDYGGDDYSVVQGYDNILNNSSDIIVIFLGVNDYLSVVDNKRFGNVEDTISTAGFCGETRRFMKKLANDYGDRQIFFVLNYAIPSEVTNTYSDITTQPTLNDYLDVERKLIREYGFQTIDLYNTGFMDTTVQGGKETYLADGVHPKDNGYQALGEHIAAELSYILGQK